MSIYRAYSQLINEVRNPQKNTQRAEKLLETSLWKTYGLKVYSKTEHAIGDLRTIIDAYEDNPYTDNTITLDLTKCKKLHTIENNVNSTFRYILPHKNVHVDDMNENYTIE